jgi:hypothetical protein
MDVLPSSNSTSHDVPSATSQNVNPPDACPTADPSLSQIFPPSAETSMNYEDEPPAPALPNIFGQLTRYQPTAPNSPPQTLPPPLNGTPSTSLAQSPMRVQGWDAENALLNLDPTQMKLWNEAQEPKILVYTWEPNYRPGQIDTASTLQKAIASAVSITEPDVGPPQAALQSRLRPAPPFWQNSQKRQPTYLSKNNAGPFPRLLSSLSPIPLPLSCSYATSKTLTLKRTNIGSC